MSWGQVDSRGHFDVNLIFAKWKTQLNIYLDNESISSLPDRER